MAAIGNVLSDIQSIENNAYLDIRPGVDEEAIVNNIYFEDNVEITFYDGTNEVDFDTATGAGVYSRFGFDVTYTNRIRVKNVGGEAHPIGYSGRYTKV